MTKTKLFSAVFPMVLLASVFLHAQEASASYGSYVTTAQAFCDGRFYAVETFLYCTGDYCPPNRQNTVLVTGEMSTLEMDLEINVNGTWRRAYGNWGGGTFRDITINTSRTPCPTSVLLRNAKRPNQVIVVPVAVDTDFDYEHEKYAPDMAYSDEVLAPRDYVVKARAGDWIDVRMNDSIGGDPVYVGGAPATIENSVLTVMVANENIDFDEEMGIATLLDDSVSGTYIMKYRICERGTSDCKWGTVNFRVP